MSRADHPTFPTCCKPWSRTTPSGRIEWAHKSSCPVSPDQLIQRPRRAERASWAERQYAATVATGHGTDCGCADCRYEMYWRDRDDDMGADRAV